MQDWFSWFLDAFSLAFRESFATTGWQIGALVVLLIAEAFNIRDIYKTQGQKAVSATFWGTLRTAKFAVYAFVVVFLCMFVFRVPYLMQRDIANEKETQLDGFKAEYDKLASERDAIASELNLEKAARADLEGKLARAEQQKPARVEAAPARSEPPPNPSDDSEQRRVLVRRLALAHQDVQRLYELARSVEVEELRRAHNTWAQFVINLLMETGREADAHYFNSVPAEGFPIIVPIPCDVQQHNGAEYHRVFKLSQIMRGIPP